VKISLLLLGIVGAALYFGGSFFGRLKLAMLGIILLGLECAIAAVILLYYRSYWVGGACAFVALCVLWGLLEPVDKK